MKIAWLENQTHTQNAQNAPNNHKNNEIIRINNKNELKLHPSPTPASFFRVFFFFEFLIIIDAVLGRVAASHRAAGRC